MRIKVKIIKQYSNQGVDKINRNLLTHKDESL